MFFDTAHNSLRTALCNAHKTFTDTAVKVWAYTRCLPRDKRPSTRLVISETPFPAPYHCTEALTRLSDTVQELSDFAFAILDGKTRRQPEYQFSVNKLQLRWSVSNPTLLCNRVF